MSRSLSFSIGLGAAVAFPATAPPGAILLGEAGPIVNHVALVGADGVPVEVVPAGGGYVPSNDNLTDLGDATHRFRTLWLGTSIRNTSSLDVLLDAGTTATFGLRNPTTAQGVLLEVDGDVRPRVAGVSSLGSALNPWLALALAGGAGSQITAAGDLAVQLSGGATRTLTIENPTPGQVASVQVDGQVTALLGGVLAGCLPYSTNAYDLGATGNRWRTLYLATSLDTPLIARNGDLTVELDGGGGGPRTVVLTHVGTTSRVDLSVSGIVQTYGTEILMAAVPTATIRCNGINGSLRLRADGNGVVALRDPADAITVLGVSGHGVVMSAGVDPSGTPTVDRPLALVTVPSGASTLVVTNNLIATTSALLATIQTTTTNPVSVQSCTPGAGSCTLTLSGDPGASGAVVAVLVLNPSA